MFYRRSLTKLFFDPVLTAISVLFYNYSIFILLLLISITVVASSSEEIIKKA